jgi:molybdopterin-containing oxidoreductase family iron-sulfur binding subunit
MSVERRDLLKLGGLAALGVVTGAAITRNDEAASAGRDAPPNPDIAQGPRLVAKRWAMVVDVSACAAQQNCTACSAACHEVHNVPRFTNAKDEVKWIWKEPLRDALPDEGHPHMADRVREAGVLVFCNHCDVPACTRVCPTGATWKRPDGVVMMDWHRCIGCRYCVAACPYGSRSFNWRDPRPALSSVNPSFPTRTRGVVEKCNFCEERLAAGEPPACVAACPHGAMIFGDLEDPESGVRRLLAERPSFRRRPALGTQPQVYYLL